MITSAEEFARLRRSEDAFEFGLAANEEAPESVWFEVIESFPELRQWGAHNKTVPVSVLESLSNDENAQVRISVAEKRNMTPALFKTLAMDPDASVRVRVAINNKCGNEILAMLALDEEAFVREAARKQLRERDGTM